MTRVHHTLCTQSDNLTAGTKHRCKFHTARYKHGNRSTSSTFLLTHKDSGQHACVKLLELLSKWGQEVVLSLWNISHKPGQPLFQIKVAANICPGSRLNCCFNLTHQGCAAESLQGLLTQQGGKNADSSDPSVNMSLKCCRRMIGDSGSSSAKLLLYLPVVL